METYQQDKLFESDSINESEGSSLFKDKPGEIVTEKQDSSQTPDNPWKVLLVDDEEDIHSVTRMALKGFSFQGREIQFLHAYSAGEARELLPKNRDIALIFLDVVMETNHAGLDLVKHIREGMKNHFTQIVLRTGYPGQAPEREVIATYEINDYKTKTELTAFKLFTVTLASLRAYDSLMRLEDLRQNLDHIVRERTAELERKNVKIMEMDQLKTRFFSNISHEFRTPLTLILNPLEDFLVDREIPAPKKDTLELMHRNAVRLLGLVNQLLDLSKIDAGSMKLKIQYLDVNKVIRSIARSFLPLAERNDMRYTLEIPEEPLSCFFDRDKLEKILMNLLSNAFKYTPEKGSVTCQVMCSPGLQGTDTRFLEIKITDTGLGIPCEQLQKIFDRFYQVEEGWKKEKGGTGIGLSLVKELTVLQHGEIRVDSVLQQGTTFTVTLPLGRDHLQPQEFILAEYDEDDRVLAGLQYSRNESAKDGPIESYAFSGNQDRPIVLVIDDSQDIRHLIKSTLSKDFNIREATNGLEGLEMALIMIPDLIITDLLMPGMDGLEVCRKLKSDERSSHIPVIMLTARQEVEQKLEGLETGADDYLTKPFHVKELNIRAKNLIDQRKVLMEKYCSRVNFGDDQTPVKSVDDKFLDRARTVIEKNINDNDFDVNSFCLLMGMSRMQLFRKLKALVNQTPSELIRDLRLQRAAQLIKQNYGNVAEVTYEVGFNNLSYFAKCFREKYGLLPSEFQKKMAP